MALPKYAGIFPHKFREDYANKPSVYMIWAGEKFLIWKGQALHNSMHHICGDLERWTRSGPPKDGHLFYGLAVHVKDNGITELEVEVVLQSDRADELLKWERALLLSNIGGAKCLNTTDQPNIPKWASAEEIEEYGKWDKLNNK